MTCDACEASIPARGPRGSAGPGPRMRHCGATRTRQAPALAQPCWAAASVCAHHGATHEKWARDNTRTYKIPPEIDIGFGQSAFLEGLYL
jgi:hypothetical protein